ncbi:hypothetical protein CAPTEDRAFT_218334 [Capitella teleta]|uniref:Uncharacterized protein n=1 Tax=Capitella teleta TaxID=283909 RepID=R7UKY3_CAPTE|nr:hypothetical protein CAPTEDRAFT_218334 [Capitella teleta]|eukprot:ELU06900.1 hypothetical protein CAPTEDRAFT_218334 [Capitella teleta]
MDTCNELTLSLIEMIDERIEEAVQVDDDEKENTPDFVYKSDVHLRLPKKNNPSVFGDSLSSGSVMNYEESHHAQEELVTVNSVSTLAPAATKQTPSTALAVKPNSDIHQHLEQTQKIRAGTDQERHPPQDVVNDRIVFNDHADSIRDIELVLYYTNDDPARPLIAYRLLDTDENPAGPLIAFRLLDTDDDSAEKSCAG